MQTDVLIIGGGATGTGIARDLALRGIKVILVEKDDLNSGASGGNHGLLHSGGRYVSNDPEAARECRKEGELIKKLMSQCVDDRGGLFVAVEGDDEHFIADYPGYCADSGILCEEIDPQEAREREPVLSDKLIAAYRVPDGSIDPFMLSLLNISEAITLGSTLIRRSQVIGFIKDGNRIGAARIKSKDTGKEFIIEANIIVNATGAWADQVARLVDVDINVTYSKGTLLITNERINHMVINRLRKPSDGDILVPGGTVSIIGTTSTHVEQLEDLYPTVNEVDLIVKEGAAMIPILEKIRYIRAFCGVRPLYSPGKADGARDNSGNSGNSGDDRSVSRGFALIDHAEEGYENFMSIIGGKLTTFRLMAERTADLVCAKLGVKAECRTAIEPLPSLHEFEWTEPGSAPKEWMRSHSLDDITVCECEMVTRTAIDEIVNTFKKNNEKPGLIDIGFRSRLGRGTCQGAFCGARTAAYLYDRGEYTKNEGLIDMKAFFQERWKGIHSILWSNQLIQAELMEAIHCGLFSEELYPEQAE